MPSGFTHENGADDWIERFCYWQGTSGKRYLFTRINPEDLPSFSDCLILLAKERAEGNAQLHWIGEIKDLTPQAFRDLPNHQFGRLTTYIHLLARTQSERQKIVTDLSNQSGMEGWTLSA